MSPPALPHSARGPVRGTRDLGHPRPILTVPPHWLRRAHTANHETHFAFFFFFPPIFCFSTPFVVFPPPFPEAKAVFLLPLLLATLHPSCQDVSRAVRICCCGSSTEQEHKGKAVAGTGSFFKEKKSKDQEPGVFSSKLPQNISGSLGHPSTFEPKPQLISSQNQKANKQMKNL